jgi:hypothetical protein
MVPVCEGAISGNSRDDRDAGEVQVVEQVLWDHTLSSGVSTWDILPLG